VAIVKKNRKIMTRHLIFFFSILIVSNLNAQITVRKDNIVEKPVFKPSPFDSTINLSVQKNPVDYKQYIGQKLFFSPKSSKYKSKSSINIHDTIITYLLTDKMTEIFKGGISYEETSFFKNFFSQLSKKDLEKNAEYKKRKSAYLDRQKELTNIYLPYYITESTSYDGETQGFISTKSQLVENKYYTIIDITGKRTESEQEYLKLEELLKDNGYVVIDLKIRLKSDTSGDTLYWHLSQARDINSFPFILVAYYSKCKSYFEQKSLISEKDMDGFVDINSGKIINIAKGEKWLCSDVSLLELESSRYCKPFYILQNVTGEEIKIELGELTYKMFITEENYNERARQEKLKVEERQREEEELERQKVEAQAKFKVDCKTRFGEKFGKMIIEGNVILGMTSEMCQLSWGEPIEKNRTLVSGLVHEQWVYSWKHYLYFENGKLTAIQD